MLYIYINLMLYININLMLYTACCVYTKNFFFILKLALPLSKVFFFEYFAVTCVVVVWTQVWTLVCLQRTSCLYAMEALYPGSVAMCFHVLSFPVLLMNLLFFFLDKNT